MNEKLEKLLENILTELKSLNQNVLVVAKNVNELKEKERVEILTYLSLTLSSMSWLRNDIRDTKWCSFKEKDEAEKVFIKLSETITKKILKLAPSIKD